MNIAHLIIKIFKSIENIVFDNVEKVNVIVGTNNSGKSSILQAIHFAVSIAQSTRFLEKDPVWQNDSAGVTMAPQQIFYTPLYHVMKLGFQGKLTQDEKNAIQIEFKFSSGEQGTVSIRRGRNKNLSVSLAGKSVISRLEDIKNPFSVYVPGLAGIAKTESNTKLLKIVLFDGK